MPIQDPGSQESKRRGSEEKADCNNKWIMVVISILQEMLAALDNEDNALFPKSGTNGFEKNILYFGKLF